MPPPPSQANLQDSWTPEPELRDTPPRRVGPSEYPDLNGVNVTLFLALGGALLIAGLVLLVLGFASSKGPLFIVGGIILALAGTALVVIFPQKQKAYLARAENLIINGVPVSARIVSSDNLTGDAQFKRVVKYQVTLPGGEMAHRSVLADDRALPRRIPGDATALVDMQTGDAELYAALPYRAIAKTAAASQTFGMPASPPPAAPPAYGASPNFEFTPSPAAPPHPVPPRTLVEAAPDMEPVFGGDRYNLGSSTPSVPSSTGGGSFGDRLPSKTPAAAAPAEMGTITPTVTPVGAPSPAAEPAITPDATAKKPEPETPPAAPQTWE